MAYLKKTRPIWGSYFRDCLVVFVCMTALFIAFRISTEIPRPLRVTGENVRGLIQQWLMDRTSVRVNEVPQPDTSQLLFRYEVTMSNDNRLSVMRLKEHPEMIMLRSDTSIVKASVGSNPSDRDEHRLERNIAAILSQAGYEFEFMGSANTRIVRIYKWLPLSSISRDTLVEGILRLNGMTIFVEATTDQWADDILERKTVGLRK